MNVPNFPDTREIRLSDKIWLTSIFNTFQPQISEYTFTNLFVWRRSKHCLLSKVKDTPIIIRETKDNVQYFLPPLIKKNLQDFMKALLQIGGSYPLHGLLKEEAYALRDIGFSIESDRDNWDYIYHIQNLIDLKGSKYKSKRQNINKCLSEHTCDYAEIDASMIPDCIQFYDRWCKYRDCVEDTELTAESDAIREVFTHYDDLAVFGAVIYVDDYLESFTIGEQLNTETAVVHFEKANPRIKGLYQLLNNWFCKYRLTEFKWVNREQDLGIPGLRRAKMDYDPDHFIEKYLASMTIK